MINLNRIKFVDLFAILAQTRYEPHLITVEKSDVDDICYNTLLSFDIVEIQIPFKENTILSDDNELHKKFLEHIINHYCLFCFPFNISLETHDFYYLKEGSFKSKICSFILDCIIDPIWGIEFWITYDGPRWLSDLLIKDPRAPKKKYKWQWKSRKLRKQIKENPGLGLYRVDGAKLEQRLRERGLIPE